MGWTLEGRHCIALAMWLDEIANNICGANVLSDQFAFLDIHWTWTVHSPLTHVSHW